MAILLNLRSISFIGNRPLYLDFIHYYSLVVSLLLKTKGLIRDLLPSRNPDPPMKLTQIFSASYSIRTFSAQRDEMPEGRWDSFNMPFINSSFIIPRHIKCPSRHTSVINLDGGIRITYVYVYRAFVVQSEIHLTKVLSLLRWKSNLDDLN